MTPIVRVNGNAHLPRVAAEALQETIETIIAESGQVTPEDMVVKAAPKESPTHGLYEWDNNAAGHKYRLQQAGGYIRTFEILFEEGAEPVRAFPHVRINGAPAYVPMARALSENDLREQLIAEAKAQAASWARRFEALRTCAEVKPIFSAIEKVAKAVKKKSVRDAGIRA
jgi:hypothetical protein